MNTDTVTGWQPGRRAGALLNGIARKRLFRILDALSVGGLQLTEGEQRRQFGDSQTDLQASMVITHPAFYRLALLDGATGAGEAYIRGYWHSPDLTRVVQLISRNERALQQLSAGPARLLQWLNRLRQARLTNSLKGARTNIQAHYDLDEQLFASFLDKRMVYSSAVFSKGARSLDEAQLHKLEILARKLEVRAADHVIEIGSGWGGMAVFLAQRYGCRVTTTTISDQQYRYTRQLVREQGLAHKITVLNKDYRELHGAFDKLISVEMIEAVGRRYMPVFFSACDRLLKSGGRAVLQVITVPGQRFRQTTRNADFIKRYIFPGGFLPSVEFLLRHARQQTRLQLDGLEDLGSDYAQTLRCWRAGLLRQREQIAALGFDEAFLRAWEFYFSYCEGGFRTRTINAAQLSFRRV